MGVLAGVAADRDRRISVGVAVGAQVAEGVAVKNDLTHCRQTGVTFTLRRLFVVSLAWLTGIPVAANVGRHTARREYIENTAIEIGTTKLVRQTS